MKTIAAILLFLFFSTTVKAQVASGKIIPIASYFSTNRDTIYELKLYGRGPTGKFKYKKIVRNFYFYYTRFGTYTIKGNMLYLKFRKSSIEMGPFLHQNGILTDTENENRVLYAENL